MPRAPVHEHGVTWHAMMARTLSAGLPPPASLVWAQASVRNPPAASGVPADHGSVPVAGSPGWEEDLPDVLSAPLALRAWPSPPAARGVHVPVSSHTTAAFPPCGPGRRSTMSVQRLPYGALFRGCSHSLMFRPVGLLATQIAPTDTAVPYGSRDFYVRASRGLLPSHAPDMLTVRIGQLTV